ncbi:MAG: hypothetical protein L0323_19100 [Planctomycetes bacterium]|nr:hypothetical protein [Planctomycetota bacterium]
MPDDSAADVTVKIEGLGPKPGVRSTEFWLHVIAMTAVALPAALADSTWAKVAAVAGGVYLAARYGQQRFELKSR